MSPEWIAAVASVATVVVIAASAFAALVQLRHMRGANQMQSLMQLRATIDSREFHEHYRAALQFLTEDLRKPEVRRKILEAPSLRALPEFEDVLFVVNIFENTGCLVKNHIIDATMLSDLLSANVVATWCLFAPFIAHRRIVAGAALLENFEYLAVICEEWMKAHPEGSYPHGVRRMANPEMWPEVADI